MLTGDRFARLKNLLNQIRRSELAHSLTLYGSSATLAQGMMMLYALLLARFLGPSDYGVFAGSYALAGITSFFFSWGMDTWLLREARGNANAERLSGTVLRIKFGLGLLWGAALVGIAPLVRPDIFSPLMVLVCAVDIWSDNCFNTLISALNVQRRLKPVSRLIIISRGGRLLGALALVGLHLVSPLVFAAGRTVFTLIGLVAASIILRPKIFSRTGMAEGGVLRHSLHFGLSEFLALIYAQADVTMLTLLGNKAQIGLYSAANGLINALFVIPNAGYVVFIPILSKIVDENLPRFQLMSRQIMIIFLALGLGLSLLVGFPVSWLIQYVLGPHYQTTSQLLMILSPILFLKSLEFGWATILVAINWQQRRLGPQAFSATSNILLNLIAIPFLGVKGVAIVYVISEALLAAGYYWQVSRWNRQVRVNSGEHA